MEIKTSSPHLPIFILSPMKEHVQWLSCLISHMLNGQEFQFVRNGLNLKMLGCSERDFFFLFKTRNGLGKYFLNTFCFLSVCQLFVNIATVI